MAADVAQVHKNMTVLTSDGTELGTVVEVWIGIDPGSDSERCDEEVCSRLEVHRGGFPRRRVLYVPSGAIAAVLTGIVLLDVDEATVAAGGWSHRPRWIGAGRRQEAWTTLSGGEASY